MRPGSFGRGDGDGGVRPDQGRRDLPSCGLSVTLPHFGNN